MNGRNTGRWRAGNRVQPKCDPRHVGVVIAVHHGGLEVRVLWDATNWKEDLRADLLDPERVPVDGDLLIPAIMSAIQDEWGSMKQVQSENIVYAIAEQELPPDVWADFSVWCLKADSEERVMRAFELISKQRFERASEAERAKYLEECLADFAAAKNAEHRRKR